MGDYANRGYYLWKQLLCFVVGLVIFISERITWYKEIMREDRLHKGVCFYDDYFRKYVKHMSVQHGMIF